MLTLFKKIFIWWNQETLGTKLNTIFYGKLAGKDSSGNKYYESKSGKVNFLFFLIYFFLISQSLPLIANEGRFVEIKVLDKVSSKTDLLKLEIGK